MTKIIKMVKTASMTLDSCGLGTLLPMFPIATGTKVRPIVVITLPVTSGGKNLRTFENTPEMRMTIIPDTMIDPNMAAWRDNHHHS